MNLYACEITEFCFEDDTITIKIPKGLKINGVGSVFVVDIQNALIEKVK